MQVFLQAKSSEAIKVTAINFCIIIKVISNHLLIWGPEVFVYALEDIKHFRRKSLSILYIFNRNVVYYLRRLLLLFKHVNCLPGEVEKIFSLWKKCYHPVLPIDAKTLTNPRADKCAMAAGSLLHLHAVTR